VPQARIISKTPWISSRGWCACKSDRGRFEGRAVAASEISF
jgi:hypothetical protein